MTCVNPNPPPDPFIAVCHRHHEWIVNPEGVHNPRDPGPCRICGLPLVGYVPQGGWHWEREAIPHVEAEPAPISAIEPSDEMAHALGKWLRLYGQRTGSWDDFGREVARVALLSMTAEDAALRTTSRTNCYTDRNEKAV